MFSEPARPWNLPELADLCSMSRATFMRHFQDRFGRSAIELFFDIRMSLGSEEHTSELQSLMRISSAVFCLKKTKHLHVTPPLLPSAISRHTLITHLDTSV